MEFINENYKIDTSRLLGTGGFSEVYLGKNIKEDLLIAIKKISIQIINNNKMKNNIIFEIEILKKLNHHNIIKYYNFIETDNYWYIITEYCNSGTLNDVIKYHITINDDKYLDKEKNTYYYLNQLKNALKYLKDFGYVHRDIKPLNILLSGNHNIKNISIYHYENELILKLADFGLSKENKDDENILMNTICGSPLYMAPELFFDKKYDSKIDLWSYGILMYELLFGIHPFKASNISQLINNIKINNINYNFNKKYTKQCFDLLIKILNNNIIERINWENFFNHDWFIFWENNFNNKESNSIYISPPNYIKKPIGINNLSKLTNIQSFPLSESYIFLDNETKNKNIISYIEKKIENNLNINSLIIEDYENQINSNNIQVNDQIYNNNLSENNLKKNYNITKPINIKKK